MTNPSGILTPGAIKEEEKSGIIPKIVAYLSLLRRSNALCSD
jgi:hypothetical protein